MKFMTKKVAKEMIDIINYTEGTGYFGYELFSGNGKQYLKGSDMRKMFRDKGFGHAETNLIMATLVNAGCKFLAK